MANFLKDTNSGDCLKSDYSKMYLQYSCVYEHKSYQKHIIGLIASFIGLIVCFLYSFTIYFIQNSAALNFVQWDMKTVTAADFTAQVVIRRQLWSKWLLVQKVTKDSDTAYQY